MRFAFGLHRASKMKLAVKIIAIVFAVYVALSVLGAILTMDIPRIPVRDSPTSVALEYQDVSFPSRGDGIVLKGWFLPGQGDTVLLIVHGGFQNRIDYDIDTLGLSRDLVQKGYNILLFDLRGRGESEGKGRTLLNTESDIGGAVDYLKSKGYLSESVGIIGYCSGAASACIFASEENIGALVLDGCFTTVRGMFVKQATVKHIPEFLLDLFIPGVSFMVKNLYGYEPLDPVSVAPKITCPTFFIHEERDNLITLEETQQLFNSSNNPANEIWEVTDAEHSQAYKTYPSLYVGRLDAFFSTRLKSSQATTSDTVSQTQ